MIQAAMGSRLSLGATPVLITPDEFEMRTDGLQLRMRADQIEGVAGPDFGTKAVGTTQRQVKPLGGGASQGVAAAAEPSRRWDQASTMLLRMA
jgi:hypothetical protein